MKINEILNSEMDDVFHIIEKANYRMTHIFVEEVLFTWHWWVGILLSIAPWIVWVIYRKKESTWRLLSAGMVVILISSWLDFEGTSLGLWHYHYDVIPINPSYEPWDFTLIPVSIMFLLQIKPHVNPFIKAFIFGSLSAFVAEPFFTWIGLYHTVHWKFIYSLPIYVVIYLIAHFIGTRRDYKEIIN